MFAIYLRILAAIDSNEGMSEACTPPLLAGPRFRPYL